MARKKVEFEITAQDKTRATFTAVNKSLGALKTAGKAAAIPALAGAAVIGGLAKLTVEAVKTADAVAKTADKIGVTTDELQELRFAADLAGVGVAGLDMGLQRFSRRVAEAAQGQGELRSVMKDYGIEARNADGSTRRVTDVMGDFAEAIKNAESDQEALRIAFKAFDSEGAALVNMLRGGKAEFDATRKKARDLGLVLEEDLLRGAEEVNDQLTILTTTIGKNFDRALLKAAPLIGDLAQRMTESLPTLIEWVDQFAQFIGLIDEKPAVRLAAINEEIAKLQAQQEKNLNLPKDQVRDNFLKVVEHRLAELRQEQAEIEATIKGEMNTRDSAPATSSPAPKGASGFDAKTADKISDAIAEGRRAEILKQEKQATDSLLESIRAWIAGEEEAEQVREEANRTVEMYLQSLKEQNQVLELEAAGKKEQAENLRAEIDLRNQIGRELLPAEREELQRLVKTQGDLNEKIGESGHQWSDMERLGLGAISSLEGGFEGLARYALQNIDKIIEGLIEMNNTASASSSGGGGLLGTLFGAIGGLFGVGSAGAMGSGANAAMGSMAVGSNGMLVGGIHSGGIAGSESTFTRRVSGSSFAGAPRHHTGGIAGMRSNEVPAILEKGEGVFTREQMKALAPAKQQAANNNTFNVNIGEGASVEAVRELEAFVRRVDGSIETRAVAATTDGLNRGKIRVPAR